MILHNTRFLALLLCTFVLLVSISTYTGVEAAGNGYHNGDIVPMQKRSQFNKFRSEWSDILPSLRPRFGLPKKTHFTLPKDVDAATLSDYKLSFSFGGKKSKNFQTTWISLFDKKGNRLSQIDFIFKHAGGHIKEFKYHTHYAPAPPVASGINDEAVLGNQQHYQRQQQEPAELGFHINYHWQELVEHDATAAINFVYVVCGLCVWLVFAGLFVSYAKQVKFTLADLRGGHKSYNSPVGSMAASSSRDF
eukprot:GEZU01016948.1.p1 GENE.GEZU01016948.1~~GEZU01016948.1.p1  ORF type:complete len:249 (+),score=40.10 GEZU01016948.1:150-896(+)